MLSKLLATTLLPLTALSSPFRPGVLSPRELPASVGTVTQFRYSGNGCTQGSNSVTRSGGWVSQTYKFSQFEADTITVGTPTTENCELHFQGAGLSPGWQVSLAEADVTGKLVLAPDAKVNYYWQVYWSDDATDTVSLIYATTTLLDVRQQ
jgi:cytoskeletal protein RodZ